MAEPARDNEPKTAMYEGVEMSVDLIPQGKLNGPLASPCRCV
jgi:hypothetical protein